MGYSGQIKQEELGADFCPPLHTMSSPRLSSPVANWKPNYVPASTVEETPLSSYSPPYKEVPLARSLRGPDGVPCGPLDSKPFTSEGAFCYTTSSSELQTLHPRKKSRSPAATRPHIPRPPNAFMIYRSELIKNRAVPLDIEHRQQNLSRLAGQCWNLLSAEEKEKYHKKAAQVLQEHQRLNPNYKFTPAPRGSRRKGKGSTDLKSNDTERIRAIREQYVKVLGPTVPASRTRRRKPRDRSHEKTESLRSTNDLSGLTFNENSNIGSLTTADSDQSRSTFFHPSVFPQVNPPRRPSTSLGIASSKSFTTTGGGVAFTNPFANYGRPPAASSSATNFSTVIQGLDIAGPVGTGSGAGLNFSLVPHSMQPYHSGNVPSPPSPTSSLPTSFTALSNPFNLLNHTAQIPKIADGPGLPCRQATDMVHYDDNQSPTYLPLDYPSFDATLMYPMDYSGFEWKFVENPLDDIDFSCDVAMGTMNFTH